MKTLFIAVVMFAVSVPASSDWTFDIGAGISQYKTAHDGLWYQSRYPHWLDMESQALSVGVSYGRNDLRYRADFMQLGWVYSSAQVVSDANNYPGTKAVPRVVANGRGHADGFVLSVSKDIGVGFYAEAGLWIFKPAWKINSYRTDGVVRTNEIETPAEWHVGPALGLGYRYKAIDLSLRYLDMQDHGDPFSQPIYNGAYVFLFKVCL